MKSERNALIWKVQGMEEIGEAMRMESYAMEPETGKLRGECKVAAQLKQQTGQGRS
jgi:hypothetical protein